MAHILPGSEWRPPMPSPPSGWSCPGCGHSYAPWVPECHHCPVPDPDAHLRDVVDFIGNLHGITPVETGRLRSCCGTGAGAGHLAGCDRQGKSPS